MTEANWPSVRAGVLLGGRLLLRERLGAGSFGTVYRARDVERAADVAVKLLHHRHPQALRRFKLEFRALAEVRHPSLVSLDELFCTDEGWLFTMELVNGQTFPAHYRAPGRRGSLRDGVDQLVSALGHLHDAGWLHRDIKPSNVLVTPEGRVVVLDFGLVGAMRDAADAAPIGSPAYAAPEQISGRPVGPPADWFGVGALLFEALTGEAPFRGAGLELLARRRRARAPAVRSYGELATDGLADLCDGLLVFEPHARHDPTARRASELPAEPVLVLVGRDEELAQVLQLVRGPDATAVVVEGESGIGKSAFIASLVRELNGDGADGWTLCGRCRPRESLGFNALDAAIDALAVALRALPSELRDACLPDDRGALAALFPVLGEFAGGAEAAGDDLRRRSATALRALLTRAAGIRRITLVIDDAHWGDADSARLLLDLLSPPSAPRVRVVLARRPVVRGESAFFDALGGPTLAHLSAMARATITLRRLGAVDAGALCSAYGISGAAAAQVVRDADGHPLFLEALARHLARGGGEAASYTSLAALQRQRVAALSTPALALLEALAVLGAGVELSLALAATGDADATVARALQADRWLKISPASAGARQIDYVHDRVREIVLDGLTPERLRAWSERWLQVLRDDVAPDLRARMLRSVGRREEALDALLRGARHAAEALAFARSERLASEALASWPEGRAGRLDALVLRAHGLMHQGFAAEAGAAFRTAATVARAEGSTNAVDLSRESAEHFLRAGMLDAGLEALRDVLGPLGLSMPRTTAAALAELLARRTLRPLQRLRSVATRDAPTLLARLDACAAVSVGLAAIDQRAAVFQARALDLALRLDDKPRLQRALSFEACYSANGGHATEARTASLVSAARAAAEALANPVAEGYYRGADALFAFHRGRWRACAEHAKIGSAIFSAAGRRYWKEEVTQGTYEALSLLMAGDYREGAARAADLLGRADARGDLYGGTNLRSGVFGLSPLLDDDVSRAADDIARAARAWQGRDFVVQHLFDGIARANLALYQGEGARALAQVDETRARLRGSLLSRAEWVRVYVAALEARASVAAALTGPRRDRDALAVRLERARRALRGSPGQWARAHGMLLDAGAAFALGSRERCCALLLAATEAFLRAEMRGDAAAAQRARGALLGGDLGRELVESAEAALRARGARRPERFALVCVPWSP